MPLSERASSVDILRSWKDQIPFHYEYSAGVAGERFLKGLRDGKIIASRCEKCGRVYLPPKLYCVECYAEVAGYVEAGPGGVVAAVAETGAGSQNGGGTAPKTFVFVTFPKVEGGIIHYAVDSRVEIGSKVVPKFRPRASRKGTIDDLLGFVKQVTP